MEHYIPEDMIKFIVVKIRNIKMGRFKMLCRMGMVVLLFTTVSLAQEPEEIPSDPSLTPQENELLTAKKAALYDAVLYLHEYIPKLDEWMGMYPSAPSFDLDKKIYDAEQGIADNKKTFSDLSGMTYTSFEEFFDWWEENSDYLEWEPGLGKLAVDELAKNTSRVINDYHVVFMIKGDEYWSARAREILSNAIEQGDYITAYINYKGHVKVKITDTGDPQQKEKGYIDATDILINKHLVTAENYLPIMTLLTGITGLEHEDYSAWVFWWDTNKDKLKLNEKGTRIVVR